MIYTCPMHPQIRQEGPGSCPICGMALVPENEAPKPEVPKEGFFKTYRPLSTIVGLILLVTIALAWNPLQMQTWDWRVSMRHFMAGFFLVFAGLKLLDVPGFAKGYATYDLLAKRVKAYGSLYPFLELILGLLYLTDTEPFWTNVTTVILMTFSGIGVLIKLGKGERFQCACLGTMIKVPLTKVTLIEDFGMAAMAAIMLVS